jgi:DNA modification methylase
MSEYRILEGDCLDVLATLPERSVQTCITSPPYDDGPLLNTMLGEDAA